eukprot:3360651-Amphidinium_carterae.1
MALVTWLQSGSNWLGLVAAGSPSCSLLKLPSAEDVVDAKAMDPATGCGRYDSRLWIWWAVHSHDV